MNLSQAIVNVDLEEVGTVEVGANNCGEKIQEYQIATWLNPDPWPWCAAFCCWCLYEALQLVGGIKDKDRCKDASAYGWEKWAKQKGHEVFPEYAVAHPGDFVVFDFSHIGIVLSDEGDLIKTVEGNVGKEGAKRDSKEGDGVYVRHRKRELVRSFIRLNL